MTNKSRRDDYHRRPRPGCARCQRNRPYRPHAAFRDRPEEHHQGRVGLAGRPDQPPVDMRIWSGFLAFLPGDASEHQEAGRATHQLHGGPAASSRWRLVRGLQRPRKDREALSQRRPRFMTSSEQLAQKTQFLSARLAERHPWRYLTVRIHRRGETMPGTLLWS